MTLEELEKGLAKYPAEKIDYYLDDDEWPHTSIRVCVINDDWEYGYGNVSFEYHTGEEWANNIKNDILSNYSIEDIAKVEGYLHSYDDSGEYEDFDGYDIEIH